ncbi:protein of unknown function [Candidatus Nitrospira inopinata]|uniref:Uncharacterized protein n=1 Tax=Candidatus Nitrospira inopinata TaxID=1715989 RepID=A0A0S4KRC1_9BACT|nr:protein of unknown function [Candidatus Nitrospira inopinata]
MDDRITGCPGEPPWSDETIGYQTLDCRAVERGNKESKLTIPLKQTTTTAGALSFVVRPTLRVGKTSTLFIDRSFRLKRHGSTTSKRPSRRRR